MYCKTWLVRGQVIIEGQLGGAGIAEHHRDALLLEQIEEGAFSTHYGQGVAPIVQG